MNLPTRHLLQFALLAAAAALAVALQLLSAIAQGGEWRASSPPHPVTPSPCHLLVVGADWCQPCHELEPWLKLLELEGVRIERVDFDREKARAEQLGVTSLPTVLAIRDHRIVGKLAGAVDLAALRGLVGLGSGSASSASTLLAAGPEMAIVRVSALGPNGARYYGSGTIVENDGQQALVVTCWHTFRDPAKSVSVGFLTGKWVPGRIVKLDERSDLAALVIPVDQDGALGVAPIAMAEENPQIGETLRSGGYGQDGLRVAWNQGRVLTYARKETAGSVEDFELSGAARAGDSGGPCLNAKGELAGVLWGTDGRIVGVTCAGRVRAFLRGVFRGRSPAGQDGVRMFPQPRAAPPVCGPGCKPGECDPGGTPIPGLANPLPLPGPAPGGQVLSPDPSPGGAIPAPMGPVSPSKEQIEGMIDEALAGRSAAAGNLPAGVQERLKNVEQSTSDERLKSLLEGVAGGTATPSPLGAILPAVLTALGWTTPPSAAVVVGLWLLRRMLAARRKNKTEGAAAAGLTATAAKEPGGPIAAPPAASFRCEAGSLAAQLRDLRATVAARISNADTGEAAALEADLAGARATIADLQKKLEEGPVQYLSPPADGGLSRMRRAMKVTSDTYPAARQWVGMFEKAYTLLQSGEQHGD